MISSSSGVLACQTHIKKPDFLAWLSAWFEGDLLETIDSFDPNCAPENRKDIIEMMIAIDIVTIYPEKWGFGN